MNTLDTRDLVETREDLQNQITEAFNEEFETELNSYDEIDFNDSDKKYNTDKLEEFEDLWSDEIDHINEIDSLEATFGSEFNYGVNLIENDNFEDYTRELLEELGYIPKDFPNWIEIDWSATSTNVQQDYTDVSYRGVSYLGRA